MAHSGIHNLTYGMYLLTTRENGQDYGCLVNTAMQVSSKPNRIAVCMYKGNLTHDMVARTGQFNLCALTPAADPELFRRFGSRSGRTVAKFDGVRGLKRSENGLFLLTEGTNMALSAKVTEQVDLDDHTLFIALVTEGRVFSEASTCSFEDYLALLKKK